MSLLHALENNTLYCVYQPIVDTYRGTVIGNESLIRGPVDTPLANPIAIFTEAARQGLTEQLERYCVENAVAHYNKQVFSGRLFINVDPNFLCNDDFVNGLVLWQTNSQTNIVLELSEQHPVEDILALKSHIHKLRTEGFKFAIDDLGAGHSSMKLWAEVRPEFVKIDRYFISDIHNNPYKREFVQHIVTLAKNLHATVIAEGIENMDELRQLQRIGIYAMQGFLIHKPSQEQITEDKINRLLTQEETLSRYDSLHALTEDTTVVSSDRKVADVLDYFQQNKRLVAIPVVDDGDIQGIIRRGQFMELMSSAYGRALYASKPVSTVMQTNFLVIDVNSPLEKASALLTEHEDTLDQMVLMIRQQGCYLGIIPVPSLLRRITELRIQNARYANPLTLLPGNVPINQRIDQSIAADQHFNVLYFDLNNFKPYNDVYGYHQGDLIIQWFAQLLYEFFAPNQHFVGHVGGDDFIVVTDGREVDITLLRALKERFSAEIINFYRSEHVTTGFIHARARNGKFQKFPILNYSVAIVQVTQRSALSHQEVASMATRLKSKAKQSKDGIAWSNASSVDLFKNA
ncbi:MAG: diguanylate cyclase/phosphodiesterase [Idiomarinaceae bacterium HL-53]|nr:MAG: diguanylate cyclase/phosphodiesterase [Idiomarinaceae bacterium HL-53]CUS48047.1 diguanylate cyclase/phosphodiesterase [Idiomarinaceae bacterium HL-53]